MTPAKIYSFSIPAGGSFPLMVIGDYCKILTSSGPLTLTGDTFGTLGPILAGQGVENSTFKRLVLTDNTGAVNKGTILIADNKFIDDRITGEVSIIDGEKSRVLAAQYFAASPAITAVNYGNIQLFNPVGSGKNVFINSLILNTQITATFVLHSASTELTNDVTNIRLSSLKIGNSVGVTKVKNEDNAVIYAYENSSFGYFVIAAGSTTALNYKNPILLTPGFGINISCMTPANTLSANISFFEEQIL